jgi:hypothetical protein
VKSSRTLSRQSGLDRAFARAWRKRDWIEHDPDFDSPRHNPRSKQARLE